MRLDTKNQRPHYRIEIVRIDVFVDDDEYLADARSQAGGGIQRLLSMGWLANFELDNKKAPAAAFLMNRHPRDSAHANLFF